MSYDLYFWRQTKPLPEKPEVIVDLLSLDEPVPGFASFPRERVRGVLKEFFADITDGDFQLVWEGAGSYFQVGFGHANEKNVHLIIVNCGFELLKTPDVVNRLIEAMGVLGCALYDPQSGKRYAQPDPQRS
jgi:hypothetical protein